MAQVPLPATDPKYYNAELNLITIPQIWTRKNDNVFWDKNDDDLWIPVKIE